MLIEFIVDLMVLHNRLTPHMVVEVGRVKGYGAKIKNLDYLLTL